MSDGFTDCVFAPVTAADWTPKFILEDVADIGGSGLFLFNLVCWFIEPKIKTNHKYFKL